MKGLMLRHASQYVERVIFLVGPQNMRSQRALERIGGRSCGDAVRSTRPRECRVRDHTR